MTTAERSSVPALRPGVRVGDVVRMGGRNVSYVRDGSGDRFFVVGLRESVILHAIDGRRSTGEISAGLQEEWGLAVDEAAWSGIRARLAALDLLATDVPPRVPPAAPEPRRSVLRGRWVMFDPTALLQRVVRAAGPLVSVPALAAYAAVSLLVLAVVAAHAGALFGSMRAVRDRPLAWLLGVVAFLTVSLLHELGHGLVCVRFGGRASEVGFRWRTPFAAFYCRTDDIRVLPGRGRRAAVALAGSVVGILAVSPLYLAWALTEGRAGHDFLAGPLLLVVVGSVVNLVPFCRLDGYAVLNHALGRADLQADAHAHLLGVLRRGARSPGAAAADRVVRLYAWAEVVVLGSAAGALLTLWFLTLRPITGPFWAASLLLLEVLVVTWALTATVARRAQARGTSGS